MTRKSPRPDPRARVDDVRVADLDYADSAARFGAIADLPWAVWLDSAARGAPDGRYDVLAADPFVTVTTRGETTEIAARGGAVTRSRGSPFALLKQQLGAARAPRAGLPFAGGAIGYFAYDLGRRLERLPAVAAADIDLPELAVGLYDWAVVVDHAERRAWLVGGGRDPRTLERWPELLERLGAPRAARATPPFRVLGSTTPSVTRAQYSQAFRRVQRHISDGDCYQVNLTQRFAARVEGDPWHAYLKLRAINPAPFAAYLDLPGGTVLCSSPELFLRVTGGRVATKPIKGTRPRSGDPERDRALAEELRASAKDRAENVMIVDLLRNDLGKSCVPGSIRATKLFEIESFASVHHLVSTVEGRLAPGKHALDLLEGCFPGGSITGAPKVRAMEIIERLEPQRRGVYCGAIGWVGFDGDMALNIAIRTLVKRGDSIYAWAGGGIVADSDVDAEYQESLDKAAALLAVLDGRAALEA